MIRLATVVGRVERTPSSACVVIFHENSEQFATFFKISWGTFDSLLHIGNSVWKPRNNSRSTSIVRIQSCIIFSLVFWFPQISDADLISRDKVVLKMMATVVQFDQMKDKSKDKGELLDLQGLIQNKASLLLSILFLRICLHPQRASA